jgi:hypothetical protein
VSGQQPQTPETSAPRLDILLALHRTAQAVRADMVAILLGGGLLVSLPGYAARLLAPEGGYGADVATLVTTLRAVLAMLYLALVSWGVVARLTGRALPPRAFVNEGLRRAQPGLKVALLVGAAIVLGLTLRLFAVHGTTQGFLLQTLLLAAGLWALGALMPAVPAAVVERLGPVAALKRAAVLTAGNRDRTLILGLISGLAVAPSGVLLASLPAPHPLLQAGFELIVWGLAAILPAVVYTGLRTSEHSAS